MNMNLGAPYEAIIQKLIDREYAGNQTEVVRQALLVYQREIEEEEAILVNKAIESEMQRIESGEKKTYTYAQVKKRFKW